MDISNFSPKEDFGKGQRAWTNQCMLGVNLLLPWFAVLDKSLEPGFLTCYMGTIIISISCILKGWNEVVWTENCIVKVLNTFLMLLRLWYEPNGMPGARWVQKKIGRDVSEGLRRGEFQPVQNSSTASMAHETKFSTSATTCLPVLLHLHYFQPHLTWLNMTHATCYS